MFSCRAAVMGNLVNSVGRWVFFSRGKQNSDKKAAFLAFLRVLRSKTGTKKTGAAPEHLKLAKSGFRAPKLDQFQWRRKGRGGVNFFTAGVSKKGILAMGQCEANGRTVEGSQSEVKKYYGVVASRRAAFFRGCFSLRRNAPRRRHDRKMRATGLGETSAQSTCTEHHTATGQSHDAQEQQAGPSRPTKRHHSNV